MNTKTCNEWIKKKELYGKARESTRHAEGAGLHARGINLELHARGGSFNLVNPLTNRKIKKDGPKYKELDKECEHLININSVCVKWLKNNYDHLYNQLKNVNVKPPDQNSERAPSRSDVRPKGATHRRWGAQNVLGFYSTKERIEYKNIIQNYFSSVVLQEGKTCVSNTKTLLKYVNNPELVGYGCFGNVYKVNLPFERPTFGGRVDSQREQPTLPKTTISVAIKEGRITVAEFKTAILKKRYPLEYLYNKLINDLVDAKTCPNFSYTFAIFFCDKCILGEFGLSQGRPILDSTNNNLQKFTQCSETIMECFDFTLNKLNDFRDEVILSILFQLLYAIASIQLKYGMFHNDVKKENVLIKVIPSGGYWKYNVRGETYYVPNYGYIAVLNDFGTSTVFRPEFSTENYGLRQAKVNLDSKNNKYFFTPFTTQFYGWIEKGKIVSVKSPKLDNSSLTQNHFCKDFDSKPSIKVDLYDMETFPAHEFNYDIVDTVRMFTGGKRARISELHPQMNISKNIYTLLTGFYTVRKDQVWPFDRVDLFLATHTIKTLFPFYVNSELPGPNIEEYSLV